MNIKFVSRSIQKYDWDCGVAAISFLLRNKGYRVNYSKLIRDLGASAEGGTDLVRIVQFLKNRPEFEAKTKSNWTFEELKTEIKKGRVLLVAYQNWQGIGDVGKPDWGHYGVIYKIEGDKVLLFDPGEANGLTKFGKEEFEKRWYEDDLGIHYFHWAMSLNL